ncbi:PilN domain-containing protein [Magnetococcales bacterium HHB-1]
MIQINLLPYREQRRQQMARRIILSWIAVGLAGAAVAFMVHQEYQRHIEDKDTIIRTQKAQLTLLDKRLKEIVRLREVKKYVFERMEVIARLGNTRELYVHVLDNVSGSIPQNVWLQSIAQKKGLTVLSGLASSNEKIAEFMRRLKEKPYIHKVELSQIAQINIEGQKLKNFTLEAAVGMPAPPKPKVQDNKKNKKQPPSRSSSQPAR